MPAANGQPASHEHESSNGVDASKDHGLAVQTALEILEIDSPLSPYLTEESYRLHLVRALEEKGYSIDDLGIVQGKIETEVDRLKRALSKISPLGEEIIEQVFSRDGEFEFSGIYGPNLFVEVARYAGLVIEIAKQQDFDVIHAHDWMTYTAGLMV